VNKMENTGKTKIEVNPNIFTAERRITKQKCAAIISTREEFEEFYVRDTEKIKELTNGVIKTTMGCYVLPHGAIIEEDLSGLSAPIISMGNIQCECIISNYEIIVFGNLYANGMISSERGVACAGGIINKDIEAPRLQINLGTLVVKGEKRVKQEILSSGKNNNNAKIIKLGE